MCVLQGYAYSLVSFFCLTRMCSFIHESGSSQCQCHEDNNNKDNIDDKDDDKNDHGACDSMRMFLTYPTQPHK